MGLSLHLGRKGRSLKVGPRRQTNRCRVCQSWRDPGPRGNADKVACWQHGQRTGASFEPRPRMLGVGNFRLLVLTTSCILWCIGGAINQTAAIATTTGPLGCGLGLGWLSESRTGA